VDSLFSQSSRVRIGISLEWTEAEGSRGMGKIDPQKM